MKNWKALMAVFIGATLALVTPVFADTIAFFGATDVNYGAVSVTFTGSGTETIVATAFTPTTSGAVTGLFSKHGPPTNGESGLGLSSDPDHEISSGGFVRLDFTSGFTASELFSIEIQSVQLNEQFFIYQGSPSTTVPIGNLIASGTGPGPIFDIGFTLAGGTSLYIVGGGSAGDRNVTVASVTTAVPEPASMMLFGTGLLSAAGLIRRKLNR